MLRALFRRKVALSKMPYHHQNARANSADQLAVHFGALHHLPDQNSAHTFIHRTCLHNSFHNLLFAIFFQRRIHCLCYDLRALRHFARYRFHSPNFSISNSKHIADVLFGESSFN